MLIIILPSQLFCVITALSFLAFVISGTSIVMVFFFNLHTITSGQIQEARYQTVEDIATLNSTLQTLLYLYNNVLNMKLDMHNQLLQSQQVQLFEFKSKQKTFMETLNNTELFIAQQFDLKQQQFESHEANVDQMHNLLDQEITSGTQTLSQQLESYRQQLEADIQNLSKQFI